MIRKIALKDAGDFFVREFGPAMRKAASKGLYSAAVRSVQLIQTEAIARATPSPVDKGIYRAGWRAEKDGEGAIIFNSVPWAGLIERGVPAANVVVSRRAVEAIGEWAVRKLGVPRERASSVAFGILRSLQRRGIFRRGEGLRILETFTRDRLPNIVADEVRRELAKL